ncbi:MAG: DUF3105 domain-containing protein [Chloroflexi bacterium]|nr:DUF3105 domain-containing protein [Chloroflexota bacterium]
MKLAISVLILSTVFLLSCGRGTKEAELNVPEATNDGTQHVAPGELHAAYSTVPATSGSHWSIQPGPGAPLGAPVCWGVYDQPIPDEALVHNLEHGGIGLHYNCPGGCPELVSGLEKLVPGNRAQFVMSPYPNMPSKIAVTAWRRLLTMEEVDAAKIKAFINLYRDRAPESISRNLFECPVKPG